MLINEFYGANKIFKQWIKENKHIYFNDLKIVIDEFSHLIVANYFLKLKSDKIYLLYQK